MSDADGSGSSCWRSWAQQDRIVQRTQQRSCSSSLLYRIDHYSSLPWAAIVVGLLLVGAVLVGFGVGFSSGWLTVFETGTSAITLVMLFVIQHTQSREQSATQRKLDELLRALPGAETGLMLLEEASDDAMRDVASELRGVKETVSSEHPSSDAREGARSSTAMTVRPGPVAERNPTGDGAPRQLPGAGSPGRTCRCGR